METFWNQLLRSESPGVGSPAGLLLSLLFSFVLGQLVAWVYIWTHRGSSYSRSYVQSLIMLSLIVTTVMLAIGNSLVSAFGLFGALALIRFRTPIKDTRDTAFLFLSVGIGICVGAQNFMLATIGTTFALAVTLYLSFTRFGDRLERDGVLRFAMPIDTDTQTHVDLLLRHYCRRAKLLHVRNTGAGAISEFAYHLSLFDPRQSPTLVQDLSTVPGLRGTSLLLQQEDEEP